MKIYPILWLTGLVVTGAAAQPARPLAPVSGYYKTLSAIDRATNPARGSLDTVRFRMQDAGKGSFVSTRPRGVYLPADVPALLTIPAPPANSSDQTRAELGYLLDLQAKRTPAEVERYTKLAAIYHNPTTSNPYDPDFARNWRSLFHVGSPLGADYTYQNLPETARLLSGVYQDATAPAARVLLFCAEISVHAAPALRAGSPVAARRAARPSVVSERPFGGFVCQCLRDERVGTGPGPGVCEDGR